LTKADATTKEVPTSKTETLEGSEGLPAPLLEAVKQRLAARLEGIAEAVQRGRRESAKMLRRVPWAEVDRLFFEANFPEM